MADVLRLTAILEREDDGYVALCPEYDVASQGSTVEEARANLIEALTLFFRVRRSRRGGAAFPAGSPRHTGRGQGCVGSARSRVKQFVASSNNTDSSGSVSAVAMSSCRREARRAAQLSPFRSITNSGEARSTALSDNPALHDRRSSPISNGRPTARRSSIAMTVEGCTLDRSLPLRPVPGTSNP